MKYVPLIWSGIWRKRGRAALLILQILIAFLLFGLLQGVKSGIDQAVTKMKATGLMVHARQGMGQSLPMAHLARIQSVPGVKWVMIQNGFVGTYQKPTQQLYVLATNLDSTWAEADDELVIDKNDIDAMASHRTGALVSVFLARKYGWKVGDRLPLQTTLRQQDGSSDWTFDIVGTFEDKENFGSDEFIFVNNNYVNEARASGKNTVDRYSVIIDDPKQVVAVSQAIDDLFANSPDETRTESWREMVQSQFQSLGDVNFIVRSIVGAVFFALLFSVGAMMMQSLRERTPELAVLKTLGFSDHKILWIILFEALVLCVVSALSGLVGAALSFPLAKDYVGNGVTIPHTVLAAGLGFAVLLAMISAALPAWRGMRLQVVDALAGR